VKEEIYHEPHEPIRTRKMKVYINALTFLEFADFLIFLFVEGFDLGSVFCGFNSALCL